MMPKRKIFYTVLPVILLSGWAWIAFGYFNANKSLTPCVFKNATGLPCPSCGTTTSITDILQGNWQEAFLHNPLGYLAIVALIAIPVWLIGDIMRKSTSLLRAYEMLETKLKRPLWLGMVLGLIGLNWIWNLLKQ